MRRGLFLLALLSRSFYGPAKATDFDTAGPPVYFHRMSSRRRAWGSLSLGLVLISWAGLASAETFRVATYNLESYLDAPTQTRHAKSAESRAKVRESILAMRPDVLALQEMGTPSALRELQDSLRTDGLDYPYSEHVGGFDTNIHVAILSRYAFSARHPRTNDDFLLSGRRYRVSRGFGEVDIQVSSHFSFTLITGHLKSRRPSSEVDEAEMRLEEAKRLRELIDARFAADPAANLVVLGDFNDTEESAF
jgi:endonuclease/exonuclease/phosphatase family metal-dependent hydrolase